jgi:hypothetical protein
MKKLILFLGLFLTLITSIGAQSYYVATKTEMYMYNTQTSEWELYQKNSDVSITVVLEDEFVHFQAKTPTIFKLYKSTRTDISGKTFEGFRYDALDLKKNLNCTIDILKLNEQEYMISVISNSREYNLRYYIKTK